MKGTMDSEKSRVIAKRLNRYLANIAVMYIKLHNYHWNVVGIGFFDFHEKLEELYNTTSEQLDMIAERIKMLEYYPLASMKEYIKVATIKEAPSEDINSSTIAQILINDFETILKDIRETAQLAGDNNDEYTIALLSEAIGFYEKNIWMFKAYLDR